MITPCLIKMIHGTIARVKNILRGVFMFTFMLISSSKCVKMMVEIELHDEVKGVCLVITVR
jgi:hypothetical protein